MKKDIHPKYYPEAKVICSCGNTFTTGSTEEVIRTDVCSACHPFFTGEQRIVDTAGQVERFMKRLEKREKLVTEEEADLEEAEEATDKKAKVPEEEPDEAEVAEAIAEKLRGKQDTTEESSKGASGKPAGKAAEATVTEKPKKRAKEETAVSEEGEGSAD